MKSRLRPEQEFTWQSGWEGLFQTGVMCTKARGERHDIFGKQPQIDQYVRNLKWG